MSESKANTKSYVEWMLGRFISYEVKPLIEEETTDKAKKIRAAYLLLAKSLLFRCQPPSDPSNSRDLDDWTIQEIIELNEPLVLNLIDILAMMKDSADWAVIALEPIDVQIRLTETESDDCSTIWDEDWDSVHPHLKEAFQRLVSVIKSCCYPSWRSRLAFIRLEWCYGQFDLLLTELKDDNVPRYIESLRFFPQRNTKDL